MIINRIDGKVLVEYLEPFEDARMVRQGEVSLVVTRHPALVDFLREDGVVGNDVKVIAHATQDDVRGRVVAGVLPMNLAAYAAAVVEVPLNLPPELRGKELSLEQMREYAGDPVVYTVRRN